MNISRLGVLDSNNTNSSFKAKLVISGQMNSRLEKICEQYAAATKNLPNDCLEITSSSFIEYYKHNDKKSLLMVFKDSNVLKKLLKEDDNTVLEKLKKISEISTAAFKTENEIKERIENNDSLIEVINNLVVDTSKVYCNAYDSLAEFVTYRTLKQDSFFGNIIQSKFHSLSRNFTGFN